MADAWQLTADKKPKVAMFSPMPPSRTGIAHYSAMLVSTPIHVVGHPSRGPHPQASPARRVAGVFGFLTSAKRGEVVLEAMAKTRDVELLVVGEAAPNIDASRFKTTGYVSDEDFDAYFARVDRIVNLRYPTAGETSGELIRAFEAGKPVAVSDYAQ